MKKLILASILFIILGRAVYVSFIKNPEKIAWPDNKITVTGYIDDYPGIAQTSNHYRLRIETVNGAEVKEKARIIVSTSPQADFWYGDEIQVNFFSFLRAEKKFADIASLVAQIRQDIEMARGVLVGLGH